MSKISKTLEAFLSQSHMLKSNEIDRYLEAHKEFLSNENISTKEIFSLQGNIALARAQELVCAKIVERTTKKKSRFFSKKEKRFVVRIKNSTSNIEVEKSFALPQEATRWGDNYLVENTSEGWEAEVYDGNSLYETITRADAFARVLMGGKKVICKRIGGRSGRLSNVMKVKGTKVYFY